MQQILADNTVLQAFATDVEDDQLEAVRSVFAGLYALDDTAEGRQEAKGMPSVLNCNQTCQMCYCSMCRAPLQA